MKKFRDRYEAGRILATSFKQEMYQNNAIVLALPRGGVPVAFEVAAALSLPLDIFIVRKLGIPNHEEYAMGAIATGNGIFLNDLLIKELNLTAESIEKVLKTEQQELIRREQLYRGKRPFPELYRKKIILVDDGIATGATMCTAIEGLRHYEPEAIIVAVPVAAYATCQEIAVLADKVVCPLQPQQFYAVSLWYEDFSQTSDEEVITLLSKSYKN